MIAPGCWRCTADYDHGVVLGMLTGMIKASDPAGDPYVQGLSSVVYAPQPLAPRDRERSIVGIVASHGEAMPVAVHSYWALMEGATVAELQRTLVYAGAFAGVERYTNGLRTWSPAG